MKKIYDLLISSILVLSLFACGFYCVFIKKHDEVSLMENRNLTTIHDLESTSFFDGTFQSAFEQMIVDQFEGRNNLVSIKNQMDQSVTSAFVKLEEDSVKLTEVGDSERYLIGTSNYLVYYPMMYDANIEKKIIHRIEEMNELQEDYPQIEMYIYRPLQAQELSIFDEENQIETAGDYYNQLFEEYSELPVSFLEIESLSDYQQMFYASDHHWNYSGSYQGYKDIMTLMDPEQEVLEPTGRVIREDVTFYGTHANFTGRVYGGDEMVVYTFDYEPYRIYSNGVEFVDNHNPNYYVSHDLIEPEGYQYFFAYTYYASSAVFVTENTEKENILVIGDSYMSPVAGLIASHYYQTYFIHPTDYLKDYGIRFNYDEFLKEHDIDKILFMYTIENYFYEDEWGATYKNFEIVRNEE